MANSVTDSGSADARFSDNREEPFGNSSVKWPRVLRRGLGLFWVIAGILQFQPLMFTPDFYAWYPSRIMESIVQTAADGQPHFVVATVHLGSSIWSTHPVLFNAAAASLQLLIGLILLFGRGKLIYAGLVLSVIWGGLVWITAEAFGDVFGGSSYFDGFPGAAVLYVISSIILLALWSGRNQRRSRSIQTGLKYLIAIYWFWVAYLQVTPSSGFWEARGLVEPFANEAAQPGPRFLALPVQSFSYVVQTNPGLVNIVVILLMLVMAFLTLFGLWNRVTMTIATIWLVWSWWFGQGFGGVFSGAGTDLNSIPVIGLWMVCLWVASRRLGAAQK